MKNRHSKLFGISEKRAIGEVQKRSFGKERRRNDDTENGL